MSGRRSFDPIRAPRDRALRVSIHHCGFNRARNKRSGAQVSLQAVKLIVFLVYLSNENAILSDTLELPSSIGCLFIAACDERSSSIILAHCVKAIYTLVNRTGQAIDSLYYSRLHFDRASQSLVNCGFFRRSARNRKDAGGLYKKLQWHPCLHQYRRWASLPSAIGRGKQVSNLHN